MLTLAQRRRAAQGGGGRTTTVSLPAPVGGWNTRDALDGMGPTDAVTLDNWYPGLGAVSVRPGSSSHATGLGGTVETLAEYYSTTTRKMLAAANNKIFNVSSAGAVGAALASGFTSNRWQTVNFKAVQFWVNGADTPQTFDGTSFAASGWTGPTSVANLVGAAVFKNFVFLWEKNSQDFWYGAVNAITGALTKFQLSMVSETGGNLVAISTLGLSENAPDDLCAFIMSSGEVILYQGSDPSNAAAWSLVGRYRIGAPVNIRAVTRYGGDTFITTLTDHTSLNSWFSAIRGGTPPQPSKLSGAVIAATAANAASFGWQAIMYPQGGKLLFNVPNANGTFHQHVLNTVTGAGCRYTGLNASCWGLYSEAIYYGGASGVVYKAETGNFDAGGVPIAADGQQAWSQLGSPQRKRVSAFRPVIQSTGAIGYSAGVGYDFQAVAVAAASSSITGSSPWDTSPWDTTPWAPNSVIDTSWRVQGGSGQSVATRLRVAGRQAISWNRTDLKIEMGANF